MDTLWHTVDVNQNIVKLLTNRERYDNYGKQVQNNCQFTASLLKRLHLVHNLEGHSGCVNCLQWSANGQHLASGSDDTVVYIWDPFANKYLHVVPTKHIGNIFSVKFVGDGGMVATCAGDCRVIVQAIADPERQIMDCNCHTGRVKRLATAPDCPALFWSAGEDGYVMQYDLRESHECYKNTVVLLDCGKLEFKCIAVNPTKPHSIAVGANDSYVRLYDRRMIKTSPLKTNTNLEPRKPETGELQDENCVQYFAPGHLARDNAGHLNSKPVVTYLAFDSSGKDLLVNVGGDHIYLFDVNNERRNSVMTRPDWLQRPTSDIDNNRITLDTYKECCKQERPKSDYTTSHKHNYKFGSVDPCSCDFMARARRCMKRGYVGDFYFAARDYLYVIQKWPEIIAAYVGIIECLILLKWIEEAEVWVKRVQDRFPSLIGDKIIKKLEDDIQIVAEAPPPQGDIGVDVRMPDMHIPQESQDYEYRFVGHCNTTTDIKEVNFMGDDGNFICAGSDDGMIFIWDRKTTNLLTALLGDVSIVNCVQPHPTTCYLASSGIDTGVKIWSPMNEDVENFKNCCAIKDLWAVLESNQDRMSMDPFDTLLINMGFRNVRSYRSPSGDISQATCRTS